MTAIKLEHDEKHHPSFNLYDDNIKVGEMVISIKDGDLTVYHTEIFPGGEGKGWAKLLLDEMVGYARTHQLKVIPLCPYVLVQFKRHPDEYADIWKKTTE